MPMLWKGERAIPWGAGGCVEVDLRKFDGGVNFRGFVRRLENVVSLELEEDVIFGEGAGWLEGDDDWIGG